jgi:tRNA-2-methylthio-N6-dimethylallyladenosine synthase
LRYFFETYGCQMNTAESAAMELVLRERGWEPASGNGDADLVLINTCSVRATAEQRVLGRLAQYRALRKRRLAEGRPFTLVLAGCMAQRLGESLKERAPVDYVMGAAARPVFPRILEAVEQGSGPIDLANERPAFSFSPLHLEAASPFRSFLPIMQGCNNFCTYCIVPYVRGREISRSPASILEELRLLADRGVREVTLLGQNVNSYMYDDGTDFPALLKLAAKAVAGTSIGRLRFLSSHPKDLSPASLEVMASYPVFCRHLHLPVQHGSSRILAAMNRRYTRSGYLNLVKDIRRAVPDISLSTDILIGFPGETGEDVEETLGLMEEIRFLYAFMYHYNPREGTAAYALPDRIPEAVKRERLARVIALQKKHTKELLKSRIGRTERVLIEGISRKNADELISRTERDEMAVLSGGPELAGSFAEVSLTALRGNTFRSVLTRVAGCMISP